MGLQIFELRNEEDLSALKESIRHADGCANNRDKTRIYHHLYQEEFNRD